MCGLFAGLVRSNLEIPQQISKFLSLYLLMSLGLKGGFSLNKNGFTQDSIVLVAIGMFLATVIPFFAYLFFQRYLGKFDSAALAATYGSVSAVTFVTASQYLTTQAIDYSGVMSAVMALMETPAIIIAVTLAAKARADQKLNIKALLHESFTEGANVLLLASLVIGIVSGAQGEQIMRPLTIDLFKGLLAFFLLDMGIQVAKRIPELKEKSLMLLSYGLVAPIAHACLALCLCWVLNVSIGNTILLMILASSASYIAVPAVVKHAIPEANPGLYFGLSLGITFPFNILIGIPLYTYLANTLLTR
jgi:hypothetical protein